jgi:formate hydrogenlyase subunit 6/NADH:ubiquinone oxidoreductase subunit I
LAKIPFIKEAVKSIFKSPVTNMYPYSQPVVPKDYRGKILFNADLCVGCGMCMRVCSPSSITKSVKTNEDTQDITMTFDMSSCTFCGMCADFCGKKAIGFSPEYSMLALSGDKSALIVEGTFTKKLPPKPAPKPVAPAANPAAAAQPKAAENTANAAPVKKTETAEAVENK